MSRSRTTASGKKAPTKMQVHIQRNIDNFKRSRPHSTKGPEVMRQYVEYMDQEHFVRKDELESSIEVVIPHVPGKDTADDHDIQYGYSLQEISEMSLQDLFGRDAAGREPVSGVLLLGHKNPETFARESKEFRTYQADKARKVLLQDSDTEETDTKPDTTVKKRQAKKKKNKKGIKSQNGSADTPHGLPSPNVTSDTSNLALQNLLERMQRMETELDGHKRIAEEERRKAEEERQRADEERQRAEEERKKADEERQQAEEERKKAEADRQVAATKQESTDRELQTLRYEIDFLRASDKDLTAWISSGHTDGEALRRIRLRNLLDLVQAKLAYYARLTDSINSVDASKNWRNELKSQSSLEDRITLARSLISTQNFAAVAAIFESPEAIKMAVEHPSQIRLDGDTAAHSHLPKLDYEAAVNEHRHAQGSGADGLAVFVEFSFTEPVHRF